MMTSDVSVADCEDALPLARAPRDEYRAPSIYNLASPAPAFPRIGPRREGVNRNEKRNPISTGRAGSVFLGRRPSWALSWRRDHAGHQRAGGFHNVGDAAAAGLPRSSGPAPAVPARNERRDTHHRKSASHSRRTVIPGLGPRIRRRERRSPSMGLQTMQEQSEVELAGAARAHWQEIVARAIGAQNGPPPTSQCFM
jgi:hypothetical protein